MEIFITNRINFIELVNNMVNADKYFKTQFEEKRIKYCQICDKSLIRGVDIDCNCNICEFRINSNFFPVNEEVDRIITDYILRKERSNGYYDLINISHDFLIDIKDYVS